MHCIVIIPLFVVIHFAQKIGQSFIRKIEALNVTAQPDKEVKGKHS